MRPAKRSAIHSPSTDDRHRRSYASRSIRPPRGRRLHRRLSLRMAEMVALGAFKLAQSVLRRSVHSARSQARDRRRYPNRTEVWRTGSNTLRQSLTTSIPFLPRRQICCSKRPQSRDVKGIRRLLGHADSTQFLSSTNHQTVSANKRRAQSGTLQTLASGHRVHRGEAISRVSAGEKDVALDAGSPPRRRSTFRACGALAPP